MKNILLLLLIVFIQSITFGQDENNIFNIPLIEGQGWSASHGSPTWSDTDLFMWYDLPTSQGEGVNYTGYSFEKGKKYQINITLLATTRSGNKPDPDTATMHILLTEKEVIGEITASNGKSIPDRPKDHLSLMSENIWSTIDKTITYKLEFIADKDYENIMFYPEMTAIDKNSKSNGSQQIETIITKLSIYNIGQQNEPIAANLTSKE